MENVNLDLIAKLISDHRDETRAEFAALRTKMDRLEQRLDGIGWRLAAMDTQFQRTNERLDGFAARMEILAARVEAIEKTQ